MMVYINIKKVKERDVDEDKTSSKLFLSYSHVDEQLALDLETELQEQGILIWRDRNNIELGQDWQDRIKEAIRSSRGVIYLGTPNAASSIMVKSELSFAKAYDKIIYPIWADGDRWAYAVAILELTLLEYVDLRGSQRDAELQRLVCHLRQKSPLSTSNDQSTITKVTEEVSMKEDKKTTFRRLLDYFSFFFIRYRKIHPLHKEDLQPFDQLTPIEKIYESPYKGLQAFTEKDAWAFFGRDDVVDTMIAEIDYIVKNESRYKQEPRFLTVVGPSGSGKSSLVMAGLLSRLKKGGNLAQENLANSDEWIYLEPMRPGKRPIEALALTLLPLLPGNISSQTVIDRLSNVGDLSPRALHHYAYDLARGHSKRVVLVIDQFEELFTEAEEWEREQFINLLVVTATEPESKLLVIVTLRVDFSDRPMKNALLHSIIEAHRISVPPMSIENLRAVIEEPARLPEVQVRFEENLVGDLLLDLRKQEQNLPLLEFTLQELFERRSEDLLTFQAYETIGRVSGALGKHAEKTYNESLSSDEQRRLARELFLRLVNPGKLEQDATRRRVPTSELALDDTEQSHWMEETRNTFVRARLLTIDEVRTGHHDTSEMKAISTIEISHEALITAWERLSGWIEEASDDMYTRQNLSNDIALWQKRARPVEQLYSGYQLAKLNEWDRLNILNTNEKKFLSACEEYEQKKQYQKQKKTVQKTIQITLLTTAFLILIVSIITALPLYNFVTSYIAPYYIPTIVTNLQDNGKGSLRQTIQDAPENSTITFLSSLSGTITLNSGDLTIAKNLTLSGPDPNNVAKIEISNGKYGKNNTATGPKIHVNAGVTVTFKNLTFAKSTVQQTAFIDNAGDLTIDNSAITSNVSFYNGGGIDNLEGSLHLINSKVEDNTTQGNGGAIYSWGGSVTIDSSKINGNQAKYNGGGIYDLAGGLTLIRSTVNGNAITSASSTSTGGGITILSQGVLILNQSTVTLNKTSGYGGGITLLGSNGFIYASFIDNNYAKQKGGGLAVERDSENGYSSLAVINDDTVATSTPKSGYYIGQNIAPSSADILGKWSHNQSNPLVVSEDTSEVTGSPAPLYPPEETRFFRGSVNLDAYCYTLYRQGAGTPSLDFTTSEDITCVLPTSGHQIQSKTVDPTKACQQQTNTPDAISRLSNYYDPSSWQCYVHEQYIGNLTAPMLNEFCQSTGFKGINKNTNGTAYDWECLDKNNIPQGLSITDACQYNYPAHKTNAFDRLIDFTKPGGWQCWAPKSGY
jgi:TIR domain